MVHSMLTPARPRKVPLAAGPMRTGPQTNQLRPANVVGQRAPDPPRQGDTPARPSLVRPYVSLGIRRYRSVMRDSFLVRRKFREPGAVMATGRATAPFRQRGNIRAPLAAGGSAYELVPIDSQLHARLREAD